LASGISSTSFTNGIASGDFSLAGLFGTASGNNSIALNGSAIGAGAVSISGTAAGDNSMALMGGATTATSTQGVAIGNSSSSEANNAFAIGRATQASGANSMALGENALASGISSTSFTNGIASGNFSLAGLFGTASGNNSIALNGSAIGAGAVSISGTAAGDNSMALMGGETTAGASNSFAFGNAVVAQGERSFAFGNDVDAPSFNEVALGFSTAPYAPSSTSMIVSTDRLFVVGNGGGAIGIPSENNAFTILKNGRTGIMRIPTTNILEVEGEASKTSAGDWVANSDRRLKKDIVTFSEEKALKKLLALRGVTYEWNDNQTGSQRPEGVQYGFIAQEIQEVFPENVAMDNLGYYQTAYGTYDALYVQSIKALHSKIKILETENKYLKNQLEEIYTLLKHVNGTLDSAQH
jgi:trimeric autotransporter adhesin